MFNVSIRIPNLASFCLQFNFVTIDKNRFWTQLSFKFKDTFAKHSKRNHFTMHTISTDGNCASF